MYVCVCNAIRESELRKFACKSVGDAERVYAGLGKRPDCGQCLEEAEAIILDERESMVEARSAKTHQAKIRRAKTCGVQFATAVAA